MEKQTSSLQKSKYNYMSILGWIEDVLYFNYSGITDPVHSVF